VTIDKDVWAGVFFASLGAFGLYLGADYPFGTTARMGAGFMPKLLCWSLLALGALIAAIGFGRRVIDPMETWTFRPLLAVLAAVIIFQALIESVGLIGATLGLTFVAGIGSTDTRWGELAIVGSAMAAASVLIFVKGLGLTMTIIPWL
jgi:putative tricarboxylic transport membrane protein